MCSATRTRLVLRVAPTTAEQAHVPAIESHCPKVRSPEETVQWEVSLWLPASIDADGYRSHRLHTPALPVERLRPVEPADASTPNFNRGEA